MAVEGTNDGTAPVTTAGANSSGPENPGAPEMTAPRQCGRGRRVAAWIGIGIAALLALLVVIGLGLNTAPGRRFVVSQLDGYKLANGLTIRIERIDGSLYGQLSLFNLRLDDTRGQFASAPRIDLDWRPFKAVYNHIDVRSATAALVTVQRSPVFKAVPSDPNAPLLPDIDIDLGRLKVDRLVLEAPVSGRRQVIGIDGTAKIADGRAQLRLDAIARQGGPALPVAAAGIAGPQVGTTPAGAAAPAGASTAAGVATPTGAATQARAIGPTGATTPARAGTSSRAVPPAISATPVAAGVPAGVAGPGGDTLRLVLDAVPAENTLIIEARLSAPQGGVVAGMAGLKAPLVATIGGRGSWADWRGRLDARLGGEPLALVQLTAKSGKFDAVGPLRPGLILEGPVARLTAPELMLAASAALDNRRADTRFSLRSTALAMTGNGLVDLGASRFGNFKVAGKLLTPGAIAPNLSGRDVQGELLLDGPFATPFVDYKISAAAIGFDKMVVEGLYAEGRARVDADRILVPVKARVARVTGLNAAAGGLLTNVSLDGNFAISGDTILSDNLKIRSPQIDATALIVADLSTGLYRGALTGKINDYKIDGVGIINLTTDAKLVTVPGGGFGLQGRFGATTVRIDNQGAADFLGGRTLVSGDVRYDPNGLATIANLRVAAPKFRLSDGRGSYSADGRIAFTAQGSHTQYGPLAVDVSGSVDKPLVRLRAARPNVGIQLTNVEAIVRGTGTGYAILASGGSPYGPFRADLLARLKPGPLTVDINAARFAGVDFAGRVQQAAAGPFVGRLTANGSGITGLITLNAAGKYQQAVVSARANGARIPGQAGLVIDRAIVEATATLYATPEVVADVQVAGLRQGELLVRTARAKINYRGGNGAAQLVADGRSGATFQIAANAQLSPKLYRVAAQGTLASVPFRLTRPALIQVEGATYRLLPMAITVPQGEVRLAGRFGTATELQARFQNFDIALLNAFAPGAGFGGRATGGLDFAQSSSTAFPRADLRVTVAGFTRSGIASVSTPVDIVAQGGLQSETGSLNALIRRGGAAIGRAQVRLSPSGAGSWSTRLMNGSLGGGIRYNGPADVLWSLAAIPNQQLSGPIGIAADVSGTIAQPRAVGVIRANALSYDNETYGTRINNIRLTGRFTNDRIEIVEFNGRAGSGTVSARGSVGFAAGSGFPIDVRATLDNAQLARSDALAARVSGDLAVTNGSQGGLIKGTLRLPEVRYEIIRQGSAEVAELSGVRRKSVSLAAARKAAAEADAGGPPGLFRLDLNIVARERLFVSGMGLESEWSADLKVGGTSAAPVVTGAVDLVRGTYSFAGKRFDLDQDSVIRFAGGPVSNPSLQISATSTISGTAVKINISGRAQDPQIALTSTPSLPQDELLSRILFGNSVTELSATQALQLAAALNSLRGSGGGLNPLGKLRSATGVDRLRILGADEATGRGTALAAGKYISNNIYVEIVTDTRGFTATQIEIALSKALSILSQTGGSNGTAVNLRYSKDY